MTARQRWTCVAVGALVVAASASAPAQEPAVAFVGVNVVPMSREDIQHQQVVIVRGDRIVEIGPASEVIVPMGATVVDGSERDLLPGLVDAHVHLEGGPFWQGSRDEFGDAPLYLSYGVTSVLNLRGTPKCLEWRQRVRAGQLLGPNIYTAGEFIIGPRGPTIRGPSGERLVGPNVETPDEVRRVVAAQAHQRVDAIKYSAGCPGPRMWRSANPRVALGSRSSATLPTIWGLTHGSRDGSPSRTFISSRTCTSFHRERCPRTSECSLPRPCQCC